MDEHDFKQLVTDIPEEVVEDTLIVTDYNTGYSQVEFHNEDSSLEEEQEKQYSYKFATMNYFKKKYLSASDDEEVDGVFLAGYKTAEEAIAGHKVIVENILTGRSFD